MTDIRDVWLLVKVPDVPSNVSDDEVRQWVEDAWRAGWQPKLGPLAVAEHIGQWLTEHDQLPDDQRFISDADLAEDGPITAKYAPYMVNVYREVRA